MNVLLSIHPYWADMIYKGKKKLEMRKQYPHHCNIGDKVFLYETYPVCAVTGCFIYNGYESFRDIEEYGEHAYHLHRITYKVFMKYYKDCEVGYAWFVGKPTKFYNPLKLPIANVKKAPQSYCYL